MAPDQLLSPLPGPSVATLLPRAAFVCVLGPVQGQTSVVQTQDLNPTRRVTSTRRVWGTGRRAVKDPGKEFPLNWLDTGKGKGDRLCHRKNLVMETRMGARHTQLRTPGSSLALGLVQSRTHPLIRAALQTFLRSSQTPWGARGSW